MVYNTASDIESHALNYFFQIFATSHLYTANDLPNHLIPVLVTEADNLLRVVLPLAEEIKHAVFFILAFFYFLYKISTMFCYLEFSCALLAFCFGNVR
jgi:hypothetical protein